MLQLRAGGVSLCWTRGPGRGRRCRSCSTGARTWAAPWTATLAEALVPPAAHSAADRPVRRRLLPMPADGWRLRPGLAGARGTAAGRRGSWSVGRAGLRRALPGRRGRRRRGRAGSPDGAAAAPLGGAGGRPHPAQPGDAPYLVSRLAVTLPLPARAVELLDLTGRWCRERIPQRHQLPQGAWVRGRAATGAPATTPPWSWPPAPPASGSAPARSGACTSAGAGTRSTGPSATPTATPGWARPSCWAPRRWPSAPARPTPPRRCWPPTAPRAWTG